MSRLCSAPSLRVLFRQSPMLVPPSELSRLLGHLTANDPDEVDAFWSAVLTRLPLDEREATDLHEILDLAPSHVRQLPIWAFMKVAHSQAANGSQATH
ncbi:hypothetical protein [Inquilinus sp. OTU3971]|uniref:hypothetical protein n=1 Tax=Inquilinus sp. OTU3971 TaxID=3043855 RepID=UPI00313D5331